MFIRRLYGTYFGILMPYWLGRLINWKKIHIIPEIYINIDKVRVLPCAYHDKNIDPFVKGVKKIIKGDNIEAYKIFRNYYKSKNIYANKISKDYFKNQYNFDERFMFNILPWSDQKIKNLSKKIYSIENSSDLKRKAIEYNKKSDLIKKGEVQNVGIISDQSIDVEFERYKFVAESIRDKGYILKNNWIYGCILKRNKKEIIVVFHGLHKTISLIALGEKRLRVALETNYKIIDLKKIKNLKVIKNGLCNTKGVFNFLDKIIDGTGII